MEMPDMSRWSGLKARAISAVVMVALVLTALWLGGFVFTLLIAVAAAIMIREWDVISAREKPYWRILGLLYVALPCASLIWLRNLDMGRVLVLFVLLAIWATDIGAFFAGRLIGGPKIAPSISPNKTWAGLGGGALASAIICAIGGGFTPYPTTTLGCIILGIVLAIVAQAGDFFESWLKRRSGVKDSGTLIPGHGGLLDRVDGLTFTMPLFALLVAIASYA
jgi:phosphatidate cytidylyltransferase